MSRPLSHWTVIDPGRSGYFNCWQAAYNIISLDILNRFSATTPVFLSTAVSECKKSMGLKQLKSV